MHDLVNDIGCAVISATLLGILSHVLRQPVILGYLLAGALIGPKLGLGIVHDSESIKLISEVGLVLLLFVIGLELRIKDLLQSGGQLIGLGALQVPLCVLLGYGLVLLLGVAPAGSLETLYLALL